jgi:hypothetical protein
LASCWRRQQSTLLLPGCRFVAAKGMRSLAQHMASQLAVVRPDMVELRRPLWVSKMAADPASCSWRLVGARLAAAACLPAPLHPWLPPACRACSPPRAAARRRVPHLLPWAANPPPPHPNACMHAGENKGLGSFDAVVIAHNGKCANRLVGPTGAPKVARQLMQLRLSAVWACMLALPSGLPEMAALEGAFVRDDPVLSWVANNSAKLQVGRAGPRPPTCTCPFTRCG